MQSFEEKMCSIHGKRGDSWLRELPTLLLELERTWGLTLKEPFPNLTYHYVAPGTSEFGRAVVLKVGLDSKALLLEQRALEAFHGRGCIEVLAFDQERGALLLEGLRPGTPLRDLEDDTSACEIASRLMQKMHRPFISEKRFCKLTEWFEALQSSQLPTQRASKLLARLLKSGQHTLLHGDLHDQNILSSGGQWIAIDPKGVIGPKGFEAGPFLRNRVQHRSQARPLSAIFAQELQIGLSEVMNWAYCDCILSACWSLQERDPIWEETLDKAQWFEEPC